MAAAIDPKKSITIVNAFVVTTVQFLNQFAVKANDKLDKLNRQIQRLEALTQLLEYKLSDIPSFSSEPSKTVVSDSSDKPSASEGAEGAAKVEQAVEQPSAPQEVPEEYKMYVNMLKYGIPRAGVEQKMRQDPAVDPAQLSKWLPADLVEA
jgi:WASH complex subunit CCDC53